MLGDYRKSQTSPSEEVCIRAVPSQAYSEANAARFEIRLRILEEWKKPYVVNVPHFRRTECN